MPKATEVAERPTMEVVPVPERLTDCGLPVALSVMLMEAERFPLADGVKVTSMEQLDPAATLEPQLLVWLKLLALVPDTATLEMFRSADPESLKVMVRVVLLEPTG